MFEGVGLLLVDVVFVLGVKGFERFLGLVLLLRQGVQSRLLLLSRLAQAHRCFAEGVALRIVEAGTAFYPFPALGLELVGLGVEPFLGQSVEQIGVGDVARVVFFGEQVAGDGATGGLVGFDANEPRHGIEPCVDFPAEQLPAQVACAALVVVHAIPDPFLRCLVVADGQGHQLVEVHLVLPEQLEEPGRDVGQLETALDGERA